MEKANWFDRVKNEVLNRMKDKSTILHTIQRRNANWFGHTFCWNCLLKRIIEGKIGGIEMT